jgi:hypothetical protein
MTPAQESYLRTLATEAGEEVETDLTKAEASKRIDELRRRIIGSGCSAAVLHPVEQFSHVFRRQTHIFQNLSRARPAEVFPPSFEDELVSFGPVQSLVLSKHPPALIDEQAECVIERVEHVLAPPMVPGVPETGDETGG